MLNLGDPLQRTGKPVMNSNAATALILVVGKESVGKSQLISSLTNRSAHETNFRGSTVRVERYRTESLTFIDTPGILRDSDTETTRLALQELERQDFVLVVVRATHLDEELAEMLPLVAQKRGAVVVTFWDKVQPGEAAREALQRLSRDAGVPFYPVNASRMTAQNRAELISILSADGRFEKAQLTARAGWRIEPLPGLLENPVLGPWLAALLLVLPAIATIFGANALADQLHPLVAQGMQPLIMHVNSYWPVWARVLLTAEHSNFGYGLLNMGPFLFVWALPTVFLFALILGAYKASGLVERINVALHPWALPFGLSGRDIVRVMMGFGCNVPAVISTRACSGCSRNTAIAAIAFGAACSYQLPATLAVLSAAAVSHGWQPSLLGSLFLGYLLVTTLIYLRLTAPAESRSSLNLLLTPSRPFMQWPTPYALWRESRGILRQFLRQALPIFVLICLLASVLAHFGIMKTIASMLGPVMAWFHLPAEAALPVVLASIRKDGIFLLAADSDAGISMSISQTLTAVYLAGVLLPCLVTVLTIGRETNWKQTSCTLIRQASFACLFAVILGWGSGWLLN